MKLSVSLLWVQVQVEQLNVVQEAKWNWSWRTHPSPARLLHDARSSFALTIMITPLPPPPHPLHPHWSRILLFHATLVVSVNHASYVRVDIKRMKQKLRLVLQPSLQYALPILLQGAQISFQEALAGCDSDQFLLQRQRHLLIAGCHNPRLEFTTIYPGQHN